MKTFQPKICLRNFASLGACLKYAYFKTIFIQPQYAYSFYAYKKEGIALWRASIGRFHAFSKSYYQDKRKLSP